MKRRLVALAGVLLLGLSASQLVAAGWIHAKALLAQQLIAHSWQRALEGAAAPRPWPWADMRPIARLTMAAHGIELFVLDSATPRALAFGPALVGGTASPASGGNTVLAAHRDTHFAFLRDVALGEEIAIEGRAGARASYRVSEIMVVDQGEVALLDPAREGSLALVTCYPFDALRPGTRLRYVVIARRVA